MQEENEMTMNLSLSILIIGHHPELVDKIIKWNNKGMISLVGMIDPLSDQISDKRISLYQHSEELDDQQIDIIFIAGKEKIYQEEAKLLERNSRLIIQPNTFWFLEKSIQLIEKIQSLTRKQKIFQTILTHSHEGVQFIDSKGIVQFVNPAFSRITNIPPEERLGKHIEEVSPDGSLNKAFKSKTAVLRYTSTSPGSNVETIANAAPIFNGDNFIA